MRIATWIVSGLLALAFLFIWARFGPTAIAARGAGGRAATTA